MRDSDKGEFKMIIRKGVGGIKGFRRSDCIVMSLPDNWKIFWNVRVIMTSIPVSSFWISN